MPRPTVYLFDIDGTLVTTGGVGRLSMNRAFEELHGRPDACSHFRLDGMTDRRIVRQGLDAIGKPSEPGQIDAVLDRYLAILEKEIATADMSRYRVHSGMREAVTVLRNHSYCALGLGTGNVRAGAKLKLEKVQLYSLFDFGGFGCDHEDRVELIRRGAERGAEKLRIPLPECRVIVIGDTPKDVQAAQAIGAECLAVATGHFSKEELLNAGAHHVFSDLTETGALDVLMSAA
jgi:phosphoglycolate phosphatase